MITIQTHLINANLCSDSIGIGFFVYQNVFTTNIKIKFLKAKEKHSTLNMENSVHQAEHVFHLTVFDTSGQF